MRRLIAFTFGTLTGGTIVSGWLVFVPSDAEPVAPTLREVHDLNRDLADERARRDAAERRELLHRTWSAIYRRRLAELGDPQFWPGPVVGRADQAEPETIPPPPVPFPTREDRP